MEYDPCAYISDEVAYNFLLTALNEPHPFVNAFHLRL